MLGNLCIPLTYVRPGERHGADIASEAMAILQRIGLEAKAHVSVSGLTLIELRKLELARAMAARPLLLIADEALAGLSGVEVDEILDILARLNDEGITMIMIEHIMRAVMRFSSRIVVLDAGGNDPRQSAVEKAYLGT